MVGDADPRLRGLLDAVAHGHPPPVDLLTELLPRPPGPVSAVLGFTGHHVVAADVGSVWLDATRESADFGSVMRAPFLAALGAALTARVGHLDVVLVGTADASASAERRLDLSELDATGTGHSRLTRALDYRRSVRAYAPADRSAIVVIGRGLAGRFEVSFEVEASSRGAGLGRRLAAAALGLIPADEPLWAQVSPGNVASLRVLLAAGYRPVGSEVLLHHGHAS